MKQENETPLYATLMYEVLKKLGVSIAEYFYLDMIHKLSYQRWCIKSLDNCAKDMNISKRGLIKMRDRLIKEGLIEKNTKGHLRVTPKYTVVAVNKVHHTPNMVVNKVPKSVNKVHRSGEQSATKNNNRITIEKEINNKEKSSKDFRGTHSPAKERLREMLKTKSFNHNNT